MAGSPSLLHTGDDRPHSTSTIGTDMTELDVPTTVTDSEKATIKEIVCEILEIDPAEVTEVSLFKEDHEADSLSAIEILSALERTFAIEIDQAKLTEMVNLAGVASVVAEARAQQ